MTGGLFLFLDLYDGQLVGL